MWHGTIVSFVVCSAAEYGCRNCTLWVHHSPEQQPAASSLPIHVAPPGQSRVLGAVVPGMSLLLGFHARGSEGGGWGGREGWYMYPLTPA